MIENPNFRTEIEMSITSEQLMDNAAEKAQQLLDKIDFNADDAAYQVLCLVTDLVAENMDFHLTTRDNYNALWSLVYDPKVNGDWDYPGQIILHLTQFIKEKDELIAKLQSKAG